jgi:GT2 family glycosyltransferase
MLRAFQADRRDVKLVVAQPAMSNAAAANLGVTQARGRWVLFLESDVVLQRGAVARLTALHANTPAPWISGGRLTDIAGRERSLTRSGSLNAFSAFAIAMGLPGAKQRRRRGPVTASPVAAVSGAFMLMPRADFEDLKGFDEGFVTAAADLDLCRRVAEAGGVVLYHPQAAGVQLGRRRSDRRVVQGLARFASKSAKTPVERVFAAIAPAALIVLMTLKDFVAGRPPHRR